MKDEFQWLIFTDDVGDLSSLLYLEMLPGNMKGVQSAAVVVAR